MAKLPTDLLESIECELELAWMMFEGGSSGAISAHCPSVRSVGYERRPRFFLAIVPVSESNRHLMNHANAALGIPFSNTLSETRSK